MRKFLTAVLTIFFLLGTGVFLWQHFVDVDFPPTSPDDGDDDVETGNMLIPYDLLEYKIVLDSTTYELGEEIKIIFNVSRSDYIYKNIADGDVHIKLEESPYYEIIGESEFIITDFDNPKYMNTNLGTATEPATFVFTIKITDPCFFLRKIRFKAKFNTTEYYYPGAGSYPSISHHQPDDEYFYYFRKIVFIADNTGVMFEQTEYIPMNHNEWNFKLLFQESLKRELENGVSMSEIGRRVACVMDGYEIGILKEKSKYQGSMEYIIKYLSPNLSIQACYNPNESWCNEFDELYETDQKSAAVIFMNVLLNGGHITQDEYNAEIELLSELSVGELRSSHFKTYLDFIPTEKQDFYEKKIDLATNSN